MTVFISSLARWKNTLIPKQSASKIPVLDPARRVDAKCCSVCSSAKSYFQPFSIFLLSSRTTDKMTQFYKPFSDVCSTFWCIQWEKTSSLRQTPVCFSLSLTLKKIFYIHIIVIQSCKSLLAIRGILAFWVSIYRAYLSSLLTPPTSLFLAFTTLCMQLHTFTCVNWIKEKK